MAVFEYYINVTFARLYYTLRFLSEIYDLIKYYIKHGPQSLQSRDNRIYF